MRSTENKELSFDSKIYNVLPFNKTAFNKHGIYTLGDLADAIKIHGLTEEKNRFLFSNNTHITHAGKKAWGILLSELEMLGFNWREYFVQYDGGNVTLYKKEKSIMISKENLETKIDDAIKLLQEIKKLITLKSD